MTYADLLPTDEDHSFVSGKTRYGKTYLSTNLLLPYVRNVATGAVERRRYLMAHDAKGTAKIPGATKVHTFRELYAKAQEPDKYPWLHYAPNLDEIDDRDLIEAFYKLAYTRGHTTVYIPELSHVCKGSWKSGYPFYLDAILKRGAELKILLIGETQEPTNIPPALISQTQCVYAFAQKLPAHREKMAAVLPLEFEDGSEDKRGALLHPRRLKKTKFYFYRDGEERSIGPISITVKKGAAPTVAERGR